MSGHSKWATTKHRKGAKDAARAKVFAKLIRQVEVAAREGGPDPDSNAALRTMFQKARDASREDGAKRGEDHRPGDPAGVARVQERHGVADGLERPDLSRADEHRAEPHGHE